MDGQMDPKLLRTISTTKKLLGKHISKPVLADKYLGRPPFRFLLEIVNSVIQQTGFMKDVFSPKELKYDEISTPENKRSILKKVIEAIENESGEKCAARTSKILSGKEPDKTNEMLQLLAKAISNFSSKSKQKQVEPVPITPDKISSGDAVAAAVAETDVQNNETTTQAEKKVDTTVKKINSKKSLPTSNKKPTTNSNVKGRSTVAKSSSSTTTTKSSSTIAKSSSSASKVSSKEAVKSKTSSPSASSASLVPPKKTSSTNLIKTVSRQSLVKSSASCSKVALTPEPLKATGKAEDVEQEQSKDVLEQQESSLSAPTPAPAMPPETSADVPTERPVTRTKYRQKNTEGESGGGDTGNLGENDATCASADDVGESASSLQNKENEDNNEAHAPQDTVSQVNQRGETRESGRSTSSEDVITEHMNQKISEWRSNSAVQGHEEREQIAGPAKTGWITDSEEMSGVASTNLSLNRVFKSEEDCAKKENNEGTTEAVVPPKPSKVTPVVKEEPPLPVPVMRPGTVLRDNESEDEDDETFLVQEKIECERDLNLERFHHGAVLMSAAGMLPSSSTPTCIDMTYLPPEQRGLLVNQILETQRELEKLSLSSSNDVHQSNMIENELAERDKAAVREVYLKQIEDLKEAIQKMSKCANPLANIVQRSQDDACLMEIEFRKLKQENERLQKKIDEAKGETSRTLYPLTEELAQLDGRIEKVEGAIILAKQRLSLIDSEYTTEFIAQLENTPTEDESYAGGPMGSDPIWQFRSFGGDDDDDDNDKDGSGIKNKSLMDVFRRAVNMHEGSGEGLLLANGRSDKKYGQVTGSPSQNNLLRTPTPPPKSERRLLNRTVYGENSPLGRRSIRALRQLEHQVEPPIDKENKPSWWD